MGPDADVDLSLVRLPADALIFPSPDGLPDSFSTPRNPNSVDNMLIGRAAKLGFEGLTFKDMRASHATLLLDKGIPVHVVAKRLGHDPAILLHIYAKRTKQSDQNAAAVIGELTRGLG